MSATCVSDDLLQYVDGNLPEAEVERVTAHLAVCSDCRNELDCLQRTRALVQRRSEVPSPSLWDGVHARIEEEKVLSLWPHLEWAAKRLVPVCAAAALLVAVLGDLNGEDATVTLEDVLRSQWGDESPVAVFLDDTDISRDDILMLIDTVSDPAPQPR